MVFRGGGGVKHQIICGDCIEVMEKEEDENINLIVADPPYGVNENYDIYEDTFENWKKVIARFIPIALKISKGAVLLSTSKIEGEGFLYANYMPKWRICWYKGASCTRSIIGFKDWELVFIYGNVKEAQTHDFFSVHANLIRNKIQNHPCPKPLGWAEWLIQKFSKENDLILDPFMGSGTTLIAAEKLKRNSIGIELSKRYCELAYKRLKNEIEQTKLTGEQSTTQKIGF